MNLEVARKCFIRCRDMKYIDLVADTRRGSRRVSRRLCPSSEPAYQSKFHEAAKEYAEGGRADKAMEMFTEMRMFDEAKVWAEEYAKTHGGETSPSQILLTAKLSGRRRRRLRISGEHVRPGEEVREGRGAGGQEQLEG